MKRTYLFLLFQFAITTTIFNAPLKLKILSTTQVIKPGLSAFKRKTDAEKVARLVIKKMKKGLMPPKIHQNEIEELMVQF